MIRNLQEAVEKMYESRGYIAGAHTCFMGAVEEMGEVSMALLLTCTSDFRPSPRKLSPEWAEARDVASEVGDVITYLLAMCNQLNITPKFKWLEQ